MPSPLEESSSPNWTTSVKTLSNSVCQTVGNFKEKIITKCQNIPINWKKSVTCVFVLILACQVSNVYLTPKNTQIEPINFQLKCKVGKEGYECTGNKKIFNNYDISLKNYQGKLTKEGEIEEEFKCVGNGKFCYKTYKNKENEVKVAVKLNGKKYKIEKAKKGKKMNFEGKF
ncbi:unnamed protein product [Meloidogyne enterolobii]|uniref:Uncharacterized protein n=1 Tax=Meloidogyne enterolobii TaxID=390850 RepID=A0ACB0Z2X5_MELEN